jgi:hypothetical protein
MRQNQQICLSTTDVIFTVLLKILKVIEMQTHQPSPVFHVKILTTYKVAPIFEALLNTDTTL